MKNKSTKRKKRRSKADRNYTDPQKPRYASNKIIEPKYTHAKHLKLICYNIKFSKKIDHAIRVLRKNRELFDADVLCLQEMDAHGVEKIAKTLKFNYVYYPATKYKKDFGNAILSKWPILNDTKVILPLQDPDKLQRIAVKATILLNNRKVIIVCTHLKVFMPPREREKQILGLLKEVIPPTNKHCIVAGDFNTFTQNGRKSVVEAMHKFKLELATKGIGWTFKHWYLANKKSSLDHIFTKGVHVIDKGKVINRSASDHVPIWIEFTL